MGAQGSTWAVEGGNKLVCSGLLKLTKANVIPARVTGISLHSSGEPELWVLLLPWVWAQQGGRLVAAACGCTLMCTGNPGNGGRARKKGVRVILLGAEGFS